MLPVLHLRRFLGIAVILIAACLLPGAALAHAGHGKSPAAASVGVQIIDFDQAVIKNVQEASATASYNPTQTAQTIPCGNKCCDAASQGCCSAAVVFSDAGAFSGPLLCLRLTLAENLILPGLNSEALPKPPRFLIG